MMKMRMIVIQTLVLFLTLGCFNGGLRQRLEKSRKIESELAETDSQFWRKNYSKVLETLNSSTLRSLNEPRAASAGLIRKNDQLALLYIYWVEAIPSIDMVIVSDEENQKIIELPISSADRALNKKESEEVVTFSATFSWKKPDIPSFFYSEEPLYVQVAQRDGKASNAVQVEKLIVENPVN